MDKANDVMSLIAEGKFNPNTFAYRSLKEEELKLELMRNKILGRSFSTCNFCSHSIQISKLKITWIKYFIRKKLF